MTAKLVERGAEVFGQFGLDGDGLAVDVGERESVSVERKAIDERPLFFTAGGAVVALELAEAD